MNASSTPRSRACCARCPARRCMRWRRRCARSWPACCRSSATRRRCAAMPIARASSTRSSRCSRAAALPLEGIVFDDLHFADDASIELLQYASAGSRRHWFVAARSAEVSAPGRALLDEVSRPARHPVPGARAAHAAAGRRAGRFARHRIVVRRRARADAVAPHRRQPAVPARDGEGLAHPGRGRGCRADCRPPSTSVHADRAAHRPPVGRRRCNWRAARRSPRRTSRSSWPRRCSALRTLDLADPWAELEAAQVLRDGAFAHDLIYESALASVPTPVARKLHAEVAAFLQEHDGEPARLAQHWAQAGQWPQAAAALSGRGRALARCLVACPSSALCWPRRRAASSGPAAPAERFDALLQRARAAHLERPRRRRQRRGRAAVEAAAGTDEQRLLALDARLELTLTRYEIDEALRLGDQAIASARALGRTDLELRFAIILSGALCDAREADEAVALLEPLAPWVRATPPSSSSGSTGRRLRWRSTTPTASPMRCPPGSEARAVAAAGRTTRHALEDDVEHRLDASQDGPGARGGAGGASRRTDWPWRRTTGCRCACCRCR